MSFQPTIPLGGVAGWTFLKRTLATQKSAHAASSRNAGTSRGQYSASAWAMASDRIRAAEAESDRPAWPCARMSRASAISGWSGQARARVSACSPSASASSVRPAPSAAAARARSARINTGLSPAARASSIRASYSAPG